MYLSDLLFTLESGVFVQVKFDGNPKPFCFTTGKKKTGQKFTELVNHGLGEAKVYEIMPLWHAQELYIRCG